MNIETLRIYCSVVRSQSFSRGAAMNNVSQSAASQAVHQLERTFGVQLIDRTKRPFVLTPEGEVCYEGLREVLQQYDAVEARVLSLRQEIAGSVRVAAIYSIGLHDMSRRMQEFMSRYPKAKVRLEFLGPNRVYEAVLDEEADLGIVSYPQAGRGLTVIPLRSENMVLVCHPDHHLARLKKVTLTQLRGENFIGFEKSLPIRKELDRHLRDNQVNVRMVMEFDNIETIKQAVEIGAGLSILPEPTIQKELKIGTLACVPLAVHKIRRPIGIIHRQRKAFTPTISKFVELLKETLGGPEEDEESPAPQTTEETARKQSQ
ncbi:MAG TPA: LysR family transcriptional regulator [Phycisphaerae bacterium]|nr:LysR family transcriptional regulator [Phycisphaerae bacterium]HOJ73304.1 LysR family transcriptional regulator [Phycisphaerae bacterium]HOM51130.1 LysR family transcriptional regulator [Phycisphaerae bacterium]HON65266.1 LysR family transcriptional regulator [Phycisphaerae bacterium]HOQ87659.1 LysR family transcriptional regulator [Phycisphaerae bacterium]